MCPWLQRLMGLLEGVGDVPVFQREGVAVLPQGGGGVAVAQELLCVQEWTRGRWWGEGDDCWTC